MDGGAWSQPFAKVDAQKVDKFCRFDGRREERDLLDITKVAQIIRGVETIGH